MFIILLVQSMAWTQNNGVDNISTRIAQIERTELEKPDEVLKYHYKARTFWTERLANANAD
jgi:hypothetical protein